MDQIHKWYSKYPPGYIFIGDIWIRENDAKKFIMTRDSFLSEDNEKIYYTKKNRICSKEVI